MEDSKREAAACVVEDSRDATVAEDSRRKAAVGVVENSKEAAVD